jgi:hypothetical protein
MQVPETAIGPNQEAATTHLQKLFQRCPEEYPDGLMEIRCIHPSEKSNSGGKLIKASMFKTPNFSDAVSWAVEMNQQGFNIYIGVNPRKPDTPPFGAASAEDVEIAFFNFADIDSQESIDILIADEKVPYTFAVTTGTIPNPRPHIYWELDSPARNLKAWSDVQSGIADHFHSDRVIDSPRIMRLAGMVSYPDKKKEEERGYVTETVTIRTEYEDDREPISPVYMHTTFPMVKSTPQISDGGSHANYTGSLGTVVTGNVDVDNAIENIMNGVEWHNNMIRVVAHWMSLGRTQNEIIMMCRQFTLPGYTQDQTDTEVLQAIEGGKRKGYDADAPQQKTKQEVLPPLEPDGSIKLFTYSWFNDIEPAISTVDLIEDTFGQGQMSTIFGESNCGKTFFATDICYHIAIGKPWRGLKTEKKMVIYCALEGGHGIRNRIAALRKHNGITPSLPFIVIATSINMLNREADVKQLIATIKQAEQDCGMKAGFIVMDTLSRALAGGNENSPDDMGALVVNSDALREHTDAHLCIIHHSGKDTAKGARGHSLLRAALDTEIEIERVGDISTATITKQREYEGGEEYGFSLKGVELGVNQNGKMITSCVVEPADMPGERKMGRPVKLNGTGKQALDVLRDTIADAGILHHNQKDFPVGVRMVPEDLFYAAYETAGVAPNGRDKQYYNQAIKNLQNTKRIIIHKSYVWIDEEVANAE